MNKNLTIPALIFLGTLLSTSLAADHFESIDRYQRQNGTSTLRTDLVASKETAYQQGHQIKSALSRQSAYQLHRTLRVPVNRLDVRSVKIDDSYVTVQELSRDPGQIEYQGMVVVRYHYRTHADR